MLINLKQVKDNQVRELRLNPDHILAMVTAGDHTIIEILGGILYYVQESLTEVEQLIRDAEFRREIKSVKYRVGDTLIFEYPRKLSDETKRALMNGIKETVGCRCIVLDDTLKFVGVVGPEQS